MRHPKKRRRWQSKPAVLSKYDINLSDGFRIVAKCKWVHGNITKFSLLIIRKSNRRKVTMQSAGMTQLMALLILIVSIRGGVIENVAVPGISSYKTAYTHAKDDLQKNYKLYWQAYLEASPEAQP